jgi:Fe-S oxidoreductase
MNYNHPQVGQALFELLEAAGYEVIVPPQVCCGRPALPLGNLELARASAQKLLKTLKPWLDQGLPVVGAEPSCVLSLRDEYPDFRLTSELQHSADKLASQSLSLPEWLLHENQRQPLPFGEQNPLRIFYHEHCHQKALVGAETSVKALKLAPGLQVSLSPAGCCGMAGSFGYEVEHVAMSRAIAQDRLLPALQKTLQRNPETQIAVSGVSCRHQIEAETGLPVKHLAEILASQLIP